MSSTSTIERISAKASSSRAGASLILESPSKRRRLSLSATGPVTASSQELWKWTLTKAAIVPCCVRDVFSMKDAGSRDTDFFWLGRVPCRSVCLVGLVVGTQVYEKRITYSIDDGTAVIECIHKPAPPTPTKPKQDKYKRAKTPEPLVELKPIAAVGTSVRIIGKVVRWHDSRQIRVDTMERCISANEEPLHWQRVLQLHKSSYSLPGPFIIPSPSSTAAAEPLQSQPISQPSAIFDREAPSSPITASSAASSAHPSPAKSTHVKSPPKLRHPSRLHSRDLTANTFRIYLKHYMDNALLVSSFPGDDTEGISYALSQAPCTPTKANRAHPVDLTPRPLQPLKLPGLEQTPRPAQEISAPAPPMGLTMSYLRRVPELADMARRVVKAEAKRRAREERHRTQAQGKEGKAATTTTSSSSSRGKQQQPEHALGPTMKRLFQVAIIKLYEEGSVVLFDGPARPLPDVDTISETSRLWKANSSTASADSTVFSSVSSISVSFDEDPGEISDPPPSCAQEEAYISLTPAHLAPYVENAIRSIMARAPKSKTATPPPGPTKEEITAFLKRADGRWERVGEWVVGDALDVLRNEDRIWCIGRGRWELCL